MTVLSKRTAAATKTIQKLYDRVLIWNTKKNNPQLSCPDIAQLLNKPESMVRRTLKLQTVLPKDLLQAIEPDAVKAWARAIPIASAKGDHRPAKDLLLHTKAIAPVADQQHQGLTVMIGSLVIPGLSRATRDSLDVNVNELNVIDVNVAGVCIDATEPVPLGADGRDGDPPPGSG